jgi:site-specific recombinase XerD
LISEREDGKGICQVKLHKVFHEAMKASGITDFRFRDLRHTFASNLVMNGVKIEKVQKLMGHKLLTMTQRYAHLVPGYLSESVKVLDRVMSQNPPQEQKVVNLNP